jgi:long-subunit acyl-CoA synthetase (AMP-forming)
MFKSILRDMQTQPQTKDNQDRDRKKEADFEAEALLRISSLFGPRIKFLVTGGGPTAAEVMTKPCPLSMYLLTRCRDIIGTRVFIFPLIRLSSPLSLGLKIMRFVRRLFPQVAFADSYGATECGAIASSGVPIKEKGVMVRLAPVSIASPDSHCGPEHDNGGDDTIPELCNEGDVGELWVSSPNMSSGYHKDEEQTKKSFVHCTDVGGTDRLWYRTGDLVRVVDRGRLVDMGRERLWQPRLAVLGRIGSAVRVGVAPVSGQQCSKIGSALVSPDVLEGIYAVSPLLSQIYIHGQSNSTALVAIVVSSSLSPVEQRGVTETESCEDSTSVPTPAPISSAVPTARLEKEQVLLAEMRLVAARNSLLPVEVPLSVHIEEGDPWTAQNNMLNASLKKRRAAFEATYRDVLRALHAPYIV